MNIDINTIIGIILLSVTSVVMFYITYRTHRNAKEQKRRCTLQVQGVVADISVDYDSTGNDHYPHRIYEYTVNGKLYRKKSKLSRIPDHQLGEVVTVFCDPKDPDCYYVEGRSDNQIAVVTMSIGILSLIGVILYVIHL